MALKFAPQALPVWHPNCSPSVFRFGTQMSPPGTSCPALICNTQALPVHHSNWSLRHFPALKSLSKSFPLWKSVPQSLPVHHSNWSPRHFLSDTHISPPGTSCLELKLVSQALSSGTHIGHPELLLWHSYGPPGTSCPVLKLVPQVLFVWHSNLSPSVFRFGTHICPTSTF